MTTAVPAAPAATVDDGPGHAPADAADSWGPPTMADVIRTECEMVAGLLAGKNRAYGNSATSPLRVFSDAGPVEQVNVRVDDKLSRISRGQGGSDEDTILDLIGYLILLRIKTRDRPDQAAADAADSWGPPTMADVIRTECEAVGGMLAGKNRAYGNSATSPLRVFSDAGPVEQVKVRVDDKLSRISRGQGGSDEDTILDLIGYLILLRIKTRRQQADR